VAVVAVVVWGLLGTNKNNNNNNNSTTHVTPDSKTWQNAKPADCRLQTVMRVQAVEPPPFAFLFVAYLITSRYSA
jgi:hypothetical protein